MKPQYSHMNDAFFFLCLIFYLIPKIMTAQIDTDVPILNHNFTLRYIADEKNSLAFNLAYDHSLSEDFIWNEIALNSVYIRAMNNFINVSGGLYINHVTQDRELTSNELRPYASFRIYRPNKYKFMVSNLSRLEVRFLTFSDDDYEWAGRFRNMTHVFYSLNRSAVLADRNFILFGYAEWFANFEKTRERFFNLFKGKLGMAYRLNFQWACDLGVIYQDTKDNVDGPAVLPVIYNTDFIFEWRISYTILSKQLLNL